MRGDADAGYAERRLPPPAPTGPVRSPQGPAARADDRDGVGGRRLGGLPGREPGHAGGRAVRDTLRRCGRREMPLNDRQARFVAEYLVDLNATRAAIRAGYSARTAYSAGERLLRNVEVGAAIAEAQAARSRRTEVTADRVVLELARVAFGDPRRVMSWGPGGVRLRPSAELADEEAAIVAEVGETTTKEGGSLRVKTVDKLGALRLLGQHLGLFLERRHVEATTIVVTRLDFSAADEK